MTHTLGADQMRLIAQALNEMFNGSAKGDARKQTLRMICPDCRGRGFTPRVAAIDDDGPMHGPCETCAGKGAIADEAPRSYICPGCRAVSYNPNDIDERYCGRCHQFADDA
jgi:DnaJ-class molecular chaperone